MELFVFDMGLNRLGIIDDFETLDIARHYSKTSELSMAVSGTKENIDLLQKGRILTKSNDLQHGYIIKHREYVDENTSRLEIIAPSVNSLLAQRITLGQQEFNGNIENVMKSFVQVNAVNPVNTNRIIPNLVISENSGISITARAGTSNKQLDEYLYSVANKHDISWDIVLDHTNKKFVFITWQGADRSTQQEENAHVIFSKEFDNILSQNYVESDMDCRTTAIVAGEGEGPNRTYVTVNNELEGLDRHELFIDARDLQSTYKNDNEEDVTMSTTEYQELLSERGKSALSEHTEITTFESEVDLYSQFRYGIDYFIGDRVSIRNDDLSVILHTRIVSAIETYNRQGGSLKIDFGDNIPSLLDKLKRAVK